MHLQLGTHFREVRGQGSLRRDPNPGEAAGDLAGHCKTRRRNREGIWHIHKRNDQSLILRVEFRFGATKAIFAAIMPFSHDRTTDCKPRDRLDPAEATRYSWSRKCSLLSLRHPRIPDQSSSSHHPLWFTRRLPSPCGSKIRRLHTENQASPPPGPPFASL